MAGQAALGLIARPTGGSIEVLLDKPGFYCQRLEVWCWGSARGLTPWARALGRERGQRRAGTSCFFLPHFPFPLLVAVRAVQSQITAFKGAVFASLSARSLSDSLPFPPLLMAGKCRRRPPRELPSRRPAEQLRARFGLVPSARAVSVTRQVSEMQAEAQDVPAVPQASLPTHRLPWRSKPTLIRSRFVSFYCWL